MLSWEVYRSKSSFITKNLICSLEIMQQKSPEKNYQLFLSQAAPGGQVFSNYWYVLLREVVMVYLTSILKTSHSLIFWCLESEA